MGRSYRFQSIHLERPKPQLTRDASIICRDLLLCSGYNAPRAVLSDFRNGYEKFPEELKWRRALEEWISLRHLETFCEVAQKKNFSKAARVIGISQPTVSEHISVLEKVLDTRLFDRVRGKVELTAAGELYLSYASRMIDLRHEAHQTLNSFLGLLQGRLAIGSSTIPASYILPDMLCNFCREFPNIRTQVKVSNSEEIENLVIAREVEIGFVGHQPQSKLFKVREFVEDEMLVAIGPDHRWREKQTISLDELKEEPLIVREPGSGTRAALEGVLANDAVSLEKDFKIAAELGSVESIKECVRGGLGVSIMSKVALEADTGDKRLKFLKGSDFKLARKFICISLSQRTPTPAAEAFFNLFWP